MILKFTFLLTPLREGRRGRAGDAHFGLHISTHAPAGGATAAPRKDMSEEYVFLLTPLREGRRPSPYVRRQHVFISTHAPAGGATSMINAKHVLSVFLLTPLREGRPAPRKDMSEEYVFLLTPLREGRQIEEMLK